MAASSQKSAFGKKAHADGQVIEAQIAQLQADLKAIADSIATLANDETHLAKASALSEFEHLAANGKKMFNGLESELLNVEGELKKTIRAKPLTAVLGAVVIGYILALLSR